MNIQFNLGNLKRVALHLLFFAGAAALTAVAQEIKNANLDPTIILIVGAFADKAASFLRSTGA